MFEEILGRPAVNFPISLATYGLVFCESLLLGLGISWIYKTKSISQDKSFQYSLWLIAPVVSTLLLFIGSNLALSIGMVGSLSVIRFRTAVKDPSDLMYLFVLIMIGLGAGTQNYVITAVAGVLMSGMLLFFASKKRDHGEKDILILKDASAVNVENAITYIKQVIPGSRLVQLSYGKSSTDATLHLSDTNEEMIMELNQKMRLQDLHLIKK